MIKRTKVYLSGPITGLDRKDYMERFRLANNKLRENGYDTCNPTKTWACRWPWFYKLVGYKLTLCYDLWLLMRCDAVYFLPECTESVGSCIEQQVAYHMHIKSLTYAESRQATAEVKQWIKKYKTEKLTSND